MVQEVEMSFYSSVPRGEQASLSSLDYVAYGNDCGNIHNHYLGIQRSKHHDRADNNPVTDLHGTPDTRHGGGGQTVDNSKVCAAVHGNICYDNYDNAYSSCHCIVSRDNHASDRTDDHRKTCTNGRGNAHGSSQVLEEGTADTGTCVTDGLVPSTQMVSISQGSTDAHNTSGNLTPTNTYRINRSYGTKESSTNWMRVLLILLAVLPSLAKGPQGSSPNSLSGHSGTALGKNGIFLQSNHTDITAQAGATAALHCRLSSPLGDGMVSWVRRRDYHLLTVGRQVYSSDARVGVKVSPDGCDWMLTVRWVAPHDAGQYECQVSSHPPQALMVNLHVVEAHAEIVGGPERFIHHGSLLKLVCLLKSATEPPVYVFWYRDDRMINYDKERGVTVDNTGKSSKLYISSVSRRDEGNYTCFPSNAAPASVMVTVIQKENPAGLQQETNTEKEASSASSSLSSSSASSSNSSSGAVDTTAILSLYLLPSSLPTLLPLFSRHFLR